MTKCERCDGDGDIDEQWDIGGDIYGSGLQECPDCFGSGIKDED